MWVCRRSEKVVHIVGAFFYIEPLWQSTGLEYTVGIGRFAAALPFHFLRMYVAGMLCCRACKIAIRYLNTSLNFIPIT